MSRKAIGHRGNGKAPRETVLLSLRKVLVIGYHRGPSYKCPSSDIIPWNFRFDYSAFCRHRMIITITMRLNRHEEDRELWLRVRLKKEFAALHELF